MYILAFLFLFNEYIKICIWIDEAYLYSQIRKKMSTNQNKAICYYQQNIKINLEMGREHVYNFVAMLPSRDWPHPNHQACDQVIMNIVMIIISSIMIITNGDSLSLPWSSPPLSWWSIALVKFIKNLSLHFWI